MRRSFARDLVGVQPRASAPPSVGASHQKAARDALSVLRGYAPRASLRGPARELYDTLSEAQLVRLAEAALTSRPPVPVGTSGGAAPAIEPDR